MKKILYVIGFLILCTSCNNTPTATKKEESQNLYKKVKYIPTKIGKYWIMKTGYLSDERDTTYIAKDTTLQSNLTLYVIENPELGGVYKTIFKKYFFYTDSAMVLTDEIENGKIMTPILFKYPKTNNSYLPNCYEQRLWNKQVDGSELYTCLESTDSLITTPAGTFNTYVYYTYQSYAGRPSSGKRTIYFFAKGIGLVKKKWDWKQSYGGFNSMIKTGNISELPNFPYK